MRINNATIMNTENDFDVLVFSSGCEYKISCTSTHSTTQKRRTHLSQVHLDGDPLILHALLQCRPLPPGVSAVDDVGDGMTSAGVTAEPVTDLAVLPRHVDDAGELAVRLERRRRETFQIMTSLPDLGTAKDQVLLEY